MTDFKYVPVIDVQQDNVTEIGPTLMLAVKNATFVALDLELSGLGDRKKVNARCMDERYASICEVAKSRSVLSVGVSCFQLQNMPMMGIISPEAQKPTRRLSFIVQTFNIMVLCSEDYVVEPRSLRFLVEHGFDFNKQYAQGISYYRGLDQAGAEKDPLRQLVASIALHSKPVIFHNGLIDLIFLYHNFYTTVPSSLAMFIADLSEMLSGGVYDTKYISEFQARLPASYLQYVFRRGQRDNQKSGESDGGPCVEIKYLPYPVTCTYINYLPCAQREAATNDTTPLCRQYASHGWCNKGKSCPESHDVDLALDFDSSTTTSKRRNRRNRKRKRNVEDPQMEVNNKEVCKDVGGDAAAGDGETDVAMDVDAAVTSQAGDEVSDVQEKSDTSDAGSDMEDTPEDAVPDSTKDLSSVQNTATDVERPVAADEEHSENEDETNQSCEQQSTVVTTQNKRAESASSCSDASSQSCKTSSTNGHLETNTGKTKSKPKVTRTDGHRAGYDAFMTGFIFAWYIAQHGSVSSLLSRGATNCLGMDRFLNKVTLCGKDVPLHIIKSSFTKTSKPHREKMQRLRESRS